MTSDAQDRVVKQLGDRYDRLKCEPRVDSSLRVVARQFGVGAVLWERVLIVAENGSILRDTGEYDIDSYEDFTERGPRDG